MVSRVIRRKHSPFRVGVFSLQKYFKIISKSLQKVVDKLKKMCYIIVTPNEKELKKMKEFKEFYEKKAAELAVKHEQWVSSNRKLRSIELALVQIKTEGDTKFEPAKQVLEAEYEKEKRKNDEACTRMYALKDFVRSMEVEAEKYNVAWDKTTEIFGY